MEIAKHPKTVEKRPLRSRIWLGYQTFVVKILLHWEGVLLEIITFRLAGCLKTVSLPKKGR